MMERGVPKYGLYRSGSASWPCSCSSVILESRISSLA